MASWKRIPVVLSEQDRRTVSGIFVTGGLEVREVRIRETPRGTPKRYLEYRDTGLTDPKIPSPDGKTYAALKGSPV